MNNTKDRFKRFEKDLRLEKENSSSGIGSNLDKTKELLSIIPDVIERFSIRSIMDAPCGDLHWMQHVDLRRAKYIGVDFLENLIQRNAHFFLDKKFKCLDLTRDALPKVDLILCRDCLVNYDEDGVRAIVENFKRSKSKYLLATHFPRPRPFQKIETGGWYCYNLLLPPFNWPTPIEVFSEKYPYEDHGDKSLGLWRIADLLK